MSISILPQTHDFVPLSTADHTDARALRQGRTQSGDLILGSLTLASSIIDNLPKKMLDSLTHVCDCNALGGLDARDLESEEEFRVLDGETAARGAECYLCSCISIVLQVRKRREEDIPVAR